VNSLRTTMRIEPHLGPDKDTPSERPIESKQEGAEFESLAQVGGLHHRYIWKAAA
jgi:hypothetical protein